MVINELLKVFVGVEVMMGVCLLTQNYPNLQTYLGADRIGQATDNSYFHEYLIFSDERESLISMLMASEYGSGLGIL